MSVLFLPPSAGAASVPDATETVSGKIRIATSAEATAGTNDVTAMTPAKTKSVVDAAVVGGVTYQGTFDASAPADLSNATKGDLYIISVAGTYQGQTWAVGDHLLINADMGGTLDPAKIDKVDNTDSVTSVAGRTGAVTLSTADISGLATVASTGAYSDLTGAPTLATVATTGAYSDLSGTPSLATVATTGAYSDLTGTPTLATVATTGAYSDLTGTPTLGTAAAEDVGTAAGNVVQLDGSARLPAVDGSQLTNLPSGASTLGALTDVDVTGAVNTNVLKYNSTSGDWEDGAVAYSEVTGTPTLATVATTGAYSDLTGTPSLATVATTGAYSDLSGTPTLGTAAALDVGTSANNVVQLDGSARLPAVDGSQLTNLPSSSVATLDDIGDVTITSVADGQFLKYDSVSGDWVNGDSGLYEGYTFTSTGTVTTPDQPKTIAVRLYNTTAQTLTLPTGSADLLGSTISIVNTGSGTWTISAAAGQYIRGLSSAPTLAQDQALILTLLYNTSWYVVAYEEQGLGSLADVNVTGAVATNVLKYDGTDWVDGAVAYSEVTGTPTLATVATTGAYSDLTGTPTLGTAAAEDVGTLAGNVVQLNGSAQLPAVDGSLLTGITASVAALDNIGDVTITSAQDYDVLKYDSGTSDWVNAPQLNYIYTSTTQSLTAKPGINRVNIDGGASSISLIVQIPTAVAARGVILHVINTGSVANDLLIGADTWTIQPNEGGTWQAQGTNKAYKIADLTPTLGTAAAEDVGTAAGNVVQLNGSAQLPAVDGSLLTGITATVAALNDIGDVSAAAPNNGDVIAYNSTTGDWEATAQSGGGGSAPSVTVSSPATDQTLTTPSGIEEVYIYTPSASITVNLVAAATCGSGFKYQIKNASANTITIDPNSTETIDGASTFALSTQYASVTIITDGSNWFII